jgi:hypothetical protein
MRRSLPQEVARAQWRMHRISGGTNRGETARRMARDVLEARYQLAAGPRASGGTESEIADFTKALRAPRSTARGYGLGACS